MILSGLRYHINFDKNLLAFKKNLNAMPRSSNGFRSSVSYCETEYLLIESIPAQGMGHICVYCMKN